MSQAFPVIMPVCCLLKYTVSTSPRVRSESDFGPGVGVAARFFRARVGVNNKNNNIYI